MTIVERNAQRLIVKSDSLLSPVTLTLDKSSGRASLARSTLLWQRKPREFPLRDIGEVTVASVQDKASGATIRQPVLRIGTDEALPLPVADKEVDATAVALREFLGLKAA